MLQQVALLLLQFSSLARHLLLDVGHLLLNPGIQGIRTLTAHLFNHLLPLLLQLGELLISSGDAIADLTFSFFFPGGCHHSAHGDGTLDGEGRLVGHGRKGARGKGVSGRRGGQSPENRP